MKAKRPSICERAAAYDELLKRAFKMDYPCVGYALDELEARR